MTGEIVILCTCSSQEEADKLAMLLVEARLAACVNALPGVRSTYRWQGAVERAEEVLLLIKTSSDLFAQVEEKLRAAHSYEVPEVLALPVCAGSANYLEWLRGNLKAGTC